MKRVFALSLVLAMTLSLASCGGNSTDTAPEETPVEMTKEELLAQATEYSIDAIFDEFLSNQIRAAETFEGKPIIINGASVSAIEADHCVLHSHGRRGSGLYSVAASLPVEELAELNSGQTIRVVGIIDGYEEGESEVVGNAVKTYCVLMSNVHYLDDKFILEGKVEGFGQYFYDEEFIEEGKITQENLDVVFNGFNEKFYVRYANVHSVRVFFDAETMTGIKEGDQVKITGTPTFIGSYFSLTNVEMLA